MHARTTDPLVPLLSYMGDFQGWILSAMRWPRNQGDAMTYVAKETSHRVGAFTNTEGRHVVEHIKSGKKHSDWPTPEMAADVAAGLNAQSTKALLGRTP